MRHELLVVGQEAARLDKAAAGAGLDALDELGVLGADLVVEREEAGDEVLGELGREEVVEEAAAAVGGDRPDGTDRGLPGPGCELNLIAGKSRWNWPLSAPPETSNGPLPAAASGCTGLNWLARSPTACIVSRRSSMTVTSPGWLSWQW